MKIALAGKGGVGKTTIAAALIALFAEKGHRIFAVDADPDTNLGSTLGFPPHLLDRLPPVIDMKDLIEERTGKGSYLILNPDVEDILDRFRLQVGSVSLFRMGGVKSAGTQCYCKENAFLKALVSALVLDRDDLVVLDFGAGIEHLTRGTAHGVDLLLVVTEPTRVSAESAATIARLGRQLGVANVKVLGNKIRTEREERFLRESFGDSLLGFIPYDPEVAEAALEPVGPSPAAVSDSPNAHDGAAPLAAHVLNGRLRQALEALYADIGVLAGGGA